MQAFIQEYFGFYIGFAAYLTKNKKTCKNMRLNHSVYRGIILTNVIETSTTAYPRHGE